MNKKLVIGLLFVAGIAGAACYGPYCYDDTGASVQAQESHAGPIGLGSRTKAQLLVTSPLAADQLIKCSDCTHVPVVGNITLNGICISTGTGQGAWAFLVSSSTICN